MTAPDLHTIGGDQVPPDVASDPRFTPRARRRLTRRYRLRTAARRVRARLTGPARMLPGVAGAGCGFAGAWLLWSLGVALLVAAGALLLVDARTPRA